MTIRHSSDNRLALALAMGVLTILILFGCAAHKPLWGDQESGLILTYRAAEGKTRHYQNTVTTVQDLEMMGQSMKTEIKTDMGFTAVSKAKQAQNLVFGITIDKFRVDIDGPRGNSSPDTSGILGKGFDMTLSPQGKELDVAGAAALTYETSPFTKSSLKSLFHRIFPDLPSHPVKVGDTWGSVNDTTTDNGAKINTRLEYIYTLEGFETVDGLECVRITGKMTGTMEGKGSQMGSDYTLSGLLKGMSTWHFAYKEGGLVNLGIKLTGDVDIKSAMGSMPMTLEIDEELKRIP